MKVNAMTAPYYWFKIILQNGQPLHIDQAATVARVLTAAGLCHHGTPQIRFNKQASSFKSEVIQMIFKVLGIEKTRMTPYRLQSHGQTEQFITTLQKIPAINKLLMLPLRLRSHDPSCNFLSLWRVPR